MRAVVRPHPVRLKQIVTTLAILIGACAAGAQELETSAAYCTLSPGTAAQPATCAGWGASVALTGVRTGASTLGLELGFNGGRSSGNGARSDEGSAQLGLNLSANEVFGPLGNVVFELGGDLRSDGLAQATLGARGVLGPLAARLTLGAHGADAAVFDPLALARDERPTFGSGFSTSFRLGLTGRPSRNLILEAEPELYLTGAGAAGRLTTRVRLLRTLGENELRFSVTAGATPGFADGYGSVGAGVLFPRGRAPDVALALHLGLADGNLTPGATLELSENLPGGLRLSLAAALEPYRRDVHPGRVAADLSLPLGSGTFSFALAAAFLDANRPAGLALQTSFSRPVTLR